MGNLHPCTAHTYAHTQYQEQLVAPTLPSSKSMDVDKVVEEGWKAKKREREGGRVQVGISNREAF